MADQPSGMERRMVHRLMAHWRSAQHEDEFPTLASVLVRDLGDIAPFIFVLKVHDDATIPVFEHVGESYFGADSSKLISAAANRVPEKTLLGQTAKNYKRVIDKTVPFSLSGDFTNAEGATILYRSAILPTRDADGYISHLIGGANCKKKV